MAEQQQWAETGLGAVVLVAAIGFLGYALAHAGGIGGSGYALKARFGEAGSLASGAAVTVAGVKIGTVSAVKLDPKTFLAEATMTIDPTVKLPSDSSIKITQDSLLGGEHLAIEPGGADDNLKPGASFQNTQGAVDLFGLIGSVLRPQSSSSTPSASTPSASSPSASSPSSSSPATTSGGAAATPGG